MTFDEAFAILVDPQHEGGFQIRKEDPGNYTLDGVLKGTKYGISARAFPGEDIENLTLARARDIYASKYWIPAECDKLPDSLRFHVFDMAVNSGPVAAKRTLQSALGVTPDGAIGPITLAAALKMDPIRLIARFSGARLLYLVTLPGWPNSSRGWARRIAVNLMGV